MAITKIGTPELFDFSATNTALQLPAGDTASRPTSPSTGEWRYNTTLKYVEYYDGAAWFRIDTEAPAVPLIPSGNFNTNTYFGNGATQEVDAKFNEAANFNGSSSGINLPSSLNTNVIDATGAFSISMWINANDLSTIQYLFCSNTSNNVDLGINTNSQGVGKIVWTIYDTSYSYLISTTTITTNTWYNIIVTYNNGLSELFINGASQGTITKTLVESNIEPTLGYRGSEKFNGKIDQVRIFNAAVTASQVTDLYTNETDATAQLLNYPVGAGCIAAYQLDGDASDISGTYGGVETDIGYTGLEFQPDFVWIKAREANAGHALFDSIRGDHKLVQSNDTAVEYNADPYGLTSFDSNGFSVADVAGGNNAVNGSAGGQFSGTSAGYVSWNWYGGGAPTTTNSAGAGNVPTAGSVKIDGADSTTALAGTTPAVKMSVNTAAGFSVVKYTQGGAANVAHGLSAAPELIINKIMLLAPSNWPVYVSSSVVSAAGFGKYISLDDSSNIASSSGVFSNVDATTFTSNWSGTTFEFINYCFISIPNYQKIGSYTGTGAAGNIISTELTVGDGGFEPAFLLIRRTDSGDNWLIFDNKRNPDDPRNLALIPNSDAAEAVGNLGNGFSFATNGFIVESTDSGVNANGGNYLYLAIAADEDTSVPTLANSFETVLYTGNGGTQNISTSFAPDLVWLKHRNNPTAHQHNLFDTIRGVTESIHSNSDQAEETVSGGLTAFNSNGFSIGSDNAVNQNSYNYVSWNWKAGGLPTINTDGSIQVL